MKIVPYKIQRYDRYEIREEVWIDDLGTEILMVSGYTLKGDYIGDENFTFNLINNWEVDEPEKVNPNDPRCTIGFNKRLQAWFGWSVNSIWGFKIGDEYFDKIEQFNSISVDRMDREVRYIKTLDEAKQSAMNFAKYAAGKKDA